MVQILGTGGDDTITPAFGSPGLVGNLPGAADDTIDAGAGSDLVLGGEGRDSIDGGDGSDTLRGEAGSDTISGGPGADSLEGGDGDYDRLSYASDTAGVTVDLAAATVRGGEAEGDTIRGFEAVTGGSGDDVLTGGFSSPSLVSRMLDGGAGRDLIRGNDSLNWLRGGDDADTLIAARGDSLEGGAGADWILSGTFADAAIYESSTAGVTVDLSQIDTVTGIVLGRGGHAEGDSLVGIENVYGSLLDDLLTGDAGANNLRGRDGNDTLIGGAGNDTLEGGLGRNLHYAGGGDDSLRSREYTDTLYGGAGNDTIVGGSLAYGEDGDDVLIPQYGPVGPGQTLDGGAGDDAILTWLADDILTGGDGSDTINAERGNDSIDGGADADSVLGGDGDDTILGGAGDDTVAGGAGADSLDGGGGFDWLDYAGQTLGMTLDLGGAPGDTATGFEALVAGRGADLADGSAGDDLLLGADGNDTLRGGEGEDRLLGGRGDDVLEGESGSDTLEGGSGADTIIGDGTDWLAYSADTAGVTVNLGAPNGAGGDAAGDWFEGSFLGLVGGQGADRLTDALPVGTTLDGGGGNDTLVGGGAFLSGGAGDDYLVTDGAAGAHTIDGGEGSDTLSAGTGGARLIGGDGDDRYLIVGAADRVVEVQDQGIDVIWTTLAALRLPDHVETLAASGGGARRLVGNGLDNAIIGAGAADTLSGGDGHDTLVGGRGDDRMGGGTGDDVYVVEADGDLTLEAANAGIDTVRTTLAALTLAVHVENLVGLSPGASLLVGNALANAISGGADADTLVGNAGADTLDGRTGADLLIGGAGDDRYLVTAVDVIQEAPNQGQDTVVAVAGSALVLPAHTEVLVLQGTTLVTGTGNGLDNILVGNARGNLLAGLAGHDSLSGGDGADTLMGGFGADTLTGGLGADRFRLDASAESWPLAADFVTDFDATAGDRVDLRGIDANTRVGGDQAFVWIGAAEFDGGGAAGAGQWRVVATVGGGWRGEGDTNGDGAADVAIGIAGTATPLSGWFLL